MSWGWYKARNRNRKWRSNCTNVTTLDARYCTCHQPRQSTDQILYCFNRSHICRIHSITSNMKFAVASFVYRSYLSVCPRKDLLQLKEVLLAKCLGHCDCITPILLTHHWVWATWTVNATCSWALHIAGGWPTQTTGVRDCSLASSLLQYRYNLVETQDIPAVCKLLTGICWLVPYVCISLLLVTLSAIVHCLANWCIRNVFVHNDT